MKLSVTLLLYFGLLQGSFGWSLRDRYRQCSTFLDCNEDECCVKGGAIGKRDLFSDLLGVVSSMFSNSSTPGTGSPDSQVNATRPRPGEITGNENKTELAVDPGNINLDDMDIGKLLEMVRGAMTSPTTPGPDWQKEISSLSDHGSATMKDFLNNYKRPAHKNGMCRKLGGEGEACVDYLEGHVCPCSAGFNCKEDKEVKFGGFGAIGGFHNLRCIPH